MTLIEIKDWSPLEFHDSDELKRVYEEYWKYFRDYKNAYSHTAGPFNLGVFFVRDKPEPQLHATQYVGIMPLLPYIKGIEVSKDITLMVSPRFSISPKMMLDKILESDDYLNNPSLLTYRDFSLKEIQEYVALDREKKEERILFGRIHGVGQIDCESFQKTKDEQKQSESREKISLLLDCYGVFEVIDFVKKCLVVCKKNIKKMSERTEENLNCKIKGRILIHKQIKYNYMKGQSYKMYCSYNKMSENIRENQILKYALYLCENSGCSEAIIEDISYCKHILADVPLKKCTMMSFVGLKNNSAYRYYKDALNAAKLIIGRYGMNFLETEDTANTETKNEKKVVIRNFNIDPFFIDMNYLFELYCRALLEKAIKQKEKSYKVSFELENQKVATRKLFKDTDESESDNVNDFFMKEYIPDIVLRYKKSESDPWKIAAVLDAKWSDLKNNKGHRRSRTHQILFYMCVLDCMIGGLIGFGEKVKGKGKNESKDKTENKDISGLKCVSDVLYNYPVDKNPKEERKLMCYLFDSQNGNKSDNEVFKSHIDNMVELLEKIQEILVNE